MRKRRIYDITNVLEGIGLIEKKSKNCIQYKVQPTHDGDESASDSSVGSAAELQATVRQLREAEADADAELAQLRQVRADIIGHARTNM